MTRKNVTRVGHFLFFYRQISQYLNMVQNSFGHTIERRCRCESRTIRNKEFCTNWFIRWTVLGRDMVFPSYIFIYRSGTELFTFTICLWKLERRGMGKCVRNCLYGTTFDFNCLLYKAFLAKFEGVLPGMIYGLFWWALLFFGVGLIAPAIKSALHLPKETIVTTICILYCMVCL